MVESIVSDDPRGVAKRKVGAALGIGIFVLPLIFSWFLLRKGYSTTARVISFGWMLVILLLVIAGGNSPNQAANANSTSAAAKPITGKVATGRTASGKHASGKQAVETAAAGTESAPEETTRLTSSQKNAVRSATQYLRMTGFSREGLIQQLSSNAGEGYDLADATVAVDSLDADWNGNAVKSAKQYLSMSGFSCQGLIEQLSSSAGDKYTVSQATYGARQAGACS